MTSVDPTPTTTLTANLSRLGLTYTADSLNDLIARATRSRWGPTVLLDTLVQAELDARARRRLERQLQAARLGRFKPLADFEWNWPKHLHRPTVDRRRVDQAPHTLGQDHHRQRDERGAVDLGG